MANIIQQLEDLKEWGQDPTRYAQRLAFRSTIPYMEVLPEEFDDLSDREDEYYRKGPWKTSREDYQKGQLVEPGPGRPGYNGRGGARPGTGGDRSMYIDYTKMIKEPTANQLKIAETVYSKQFNNLKGMDLWKKLGTTKRSNIVQKHITGGTSGVPGGKLKKNQLGKDDFIKLVKANKDKTYNEFVEIIKKYKTKDGQPFTKQIVANRLRDYNLSGSFQKEPPKGDSPEAKKAAEKKRKIWIDRTAPATKRVGGTTEFPFHHIMQIGGEVPLTTDDIAIIEQRMNSKLSKYNKPLNNIADAISKNHKLALEAMNAKNEGLALDYMKRVNQLNESAEKIVNKAIKELPKSYRNLIGFNQFTLPTNEYGLPIQNEPLLVKKIGGAPVTKDAIPLTDLTLDQETALRAQIKADAKAGKITTNKTKKNIIFQLEKSKIRCIKGVGGQCNTPADYRKGFNEVVQRSAAGDKKALTKLQKFTQGMKKIKGPAKWTWYGLLGEIGFMVPFGVADYTTGESWKRIMGNASDWGFGPMFGQSEDEEIIANLPEGSLGAEGQEALAASKRLRALEDPNRNFPKGRIGMDPQRFEESQIKVMQDAALDLRNKINPFMEGPRNQYLNIDKADQSMRDWAASQELIQAQKEQRIQERRDRGFIAEEGWEKNMRMGRMGGGIAGVRRPNAIPPVSGPMPQGGGLSTMFNRVKPW